MRQSVVICDDSAMARHQMRASLPGEWEVEIAFAANGEEALDLVRAAPRALMFLDLTMPVLNGYEVLEQLKEEGLSCGVFVVSADIQPEAVERVTDLGALEFLAKPVNRDVLRERLRAHGLLAVDPREERGVEKPHE